MAAEKQSAFGLVAKNGTQIFRIFRIDADTKNPADLDNPGNLRSIKNTIHSNIYSSILMHKLLWCCLFIAGIITAQCQPVSVDTLVKRLGNNLVQQPNGAGLSIGIFYAGQTWLYNFGTVERGLTKTPTENTLYEIGSLTKTFVSLALAQAVVDKKVKLDDDIRKYMPGSYPNLEYNHQPITLLNLANTTSGLPDVLPSAPESLIKNAQEDSISYIIENYYSNLTEKDFFEALHTVKLDTLPGYYPRHSNCAAQLLGYIMQRVYNKPLYNIIKDNVLQPLHMQNTFFAASVPVDKKVANGYNNNGKLAPHLAQQYMQASGGLISTTADLLKYITFLLQRKKPAVQMALTKNILIDAGTNKTIGQYPKDTVNDRVYSASFNWWQYTPEKGKEQIFSDSGTMGFCSYIILYPQARLGIVLLSNRSGADASGALGNIADNIFKALKKE